MKYLCPGCDKEVRVGSPCPHCNRKKKPAREKVRDSWKQDRATDGLDLPDNDFDYDSFVRSEFGTAPHNRLGIKWYWYLAALLLLTGLMVGVFLH
jgi:hypothetical protein